MGNKNNKMDGLIEANGSVVGLAISKTKIYIRSTFLRSVAY